MVQALGVKQNITIFNVRVHTSVTHSSKQIRIKTLVVTQTKQLNPKDFNRVRLVCFDVAQRILLILTGICLIVRDLNT